MIIVQIVEVIFGMIIVQIDEVKFGQDCADDVNGPVGGMSQLVCMQTNIPMCRTQSEL